MKMKLYYVVKKANGFYDKHDFDYVAGPLALMLRTSTRMLLTKGGICML